MSKVSEMSKTLTPKDAFDTKEMSKMSKNVKSASDFDDLTNLSKTLTKPKEEVAGPKIASKYIEMSTF